MPSRYAHTKKEPTCCGSEPHISKEQVAYVICKGLLHIDDFLIVLTNIKIISKDNNIIATTTGRRRRRITSTVTVWSIKILFLLSLTCFNALKSAHSYLCHYPSTQRLECCIVNGGVRPCPGPFILIYAFGDPSAISLFPHPAVIWHRVDTRVVRWHRKTTALELVAFQSANDTPGLIDKELNDKRNFQISCCGVGSHTCWSRSIYVCRNHVEGKELQMSITVPTIYRNVVYAVGWEFYGGGIFVIGLSSEIIIRVYSCVFRMARLWQQSGRRGYCLEEGHSNINCACWQRTNWACVRKSRVTSTM